MKALRSQVAALLIGALPMLLVGVAGCRPADADAVSGAGEDAPRWAPGEEWRLSDEPFLTIGSLDGPEAIGSVGRITDQSQSGVALLGGGRVAVADGQAEEIRIYDAAGTRLAAVGRAGEGPGEFQGLRGIRAFGGDSLLAWDSRAGFYVGRLSVFTAEGAFVRTVPNTAPIRGVVGVTEDGTLLLEPQPASPPDWSRPAVGEYREPRLFRWMAASGEPLGTFGPVPGWEYAAMGASQRDLVHFGRDTYVAVGSRFIYVADSERFEIAVHDRDTGQLLRHVRRPWEPVPVTPQQLAGRIELLRTANERAAQIGPPLQRPDPKDIPARDTHPVFSRILVDADDNLWVRHLLPAGDTVQTWSVFGAEGVWLGETSLPRRMTLVAIGSAELAAVITDELGVQYVQLFRLLK